MKLINQTFREDGVFGELLDDSSAHICYVLTHAFQSPGGDFVGKTPDGVYSCKRGTHRLEHGAPFETFEITGVPPFQGHPVTGILFHVGNFNRDSDGCYLLGEYTVISAVDNVEILSNSKKAFDAFMARMAGIDTFELTISSLPASS